MKQRSRIRWQLSFLALAGVTAVLAAPQLARTGLGGSPVSVAEALDAPEVIPADLVALASVREPKPATGRHLGFDTNIYPGDRAMRAWRETAPYEWVGYYLPAPCHKDESWSGKRERLDAMGWGMAVIYVGQQTWDGARQLTPAQVAAKRRAGTLTCHRSLLGAARGRAEADDAIARTAAEGFPRGTVIFLDIEYMTRTPPEMRDYYSAWTRRVLADGRYRPGYYVHTRNAERVYADIKSVFAAAGAVEEPPFWVAAPRDFTPDKEPHEVGHRFAAVWQGMLDIAQTWDGIRLPIDVNVAAVPSPSSHAYAGAPAAEARYALSADAAEAEARSGD